LQQDNCPNIVLIVIDALRVKPLGCYGGNVPTPTMNKLSTEGTIFQKAFSCANLTDPSITSILTGKYPISHGIISHGYSAYDYRNEINEFVSLAEDLKRFGYLTFGIDWLGRWHKKGFDFYSGIIEKRKIRQLLKKVTQKIPFFIKSILDKKLGSYMPDIYYPSATEQTKLATNIISKYFDKPFFLFIHYWDTHYPYNSPSVYIDNIYDFVKKEFNNDIKNFDDIIKSTCSPFYKSVFRRFHMKGTTPLDLIARYYGSISYVDFEINKLYETLRRYNLLEKTIIILTSDHGESLGEHGVFFNHHGLYDLTTHIPLIIRHPNLPKNNLECFVQHVDIVPTILDMIGKYDFSNNMYDGSSLIPVIKSEKDKIRTSVLIHEDSWWAGQRIALRTNEYKFIREMTEHNSICKYCKKKHLPPIELYNIIRDPKELDNLADIKLNLVKKYENILQNYLASLKSYKSRVRE